MARYELSIVEWMTLWHRADQMGVSVIAGRNVRKDCWNVRVIQGARFVKLEGHGPLYAVACGALDDFEAQLYTPDELVQIQRQSA